jgi:transposase
MARNNPENRAMRLNTDKQRVRRRYRSNVTRGRRIRVGEKEIITNQVVIFTIAGYSPTQISRIIGISRGRVRGILDEDETQGIMAETLAGLTEAAADLLRGYSVEAVQAIVDVMRSSSDDGVILKAAAEVLDRSGLPKASRSEQKVHKTNENMTTITDDGIVDKLREASPEIQEQAATLVEQLEGLLTIAANEEVVDETDPE